MKIVRSQLAQDDRVSYDGFTFGVASRKWRLAHGVVAYIGWIDSLLGEPLKTSFAGVLAHYAQTYSAGHTVNMSERFHDLARFISRSGPAPVILTAAHLLNYRASLDNAHEWYLGSLRGFLKTWLKLGRAGVDASVAPLLDDWRLRGNPKGHAVRTACPRRGALTDLEVEALHQALITAFEAKKLCAEEFALLLLFVTTGRRPAQLADLKVKDLLTAGEGNAPRHHILNVPRRKQRGLRWREQFKPYALAEEVGSALRVHINELLLKAACLLRDVDPMAVSSLPLFPNWRRLRNAVKQEGRSLIVSSIVGQTFHCTRETLYRRLVAITKGLNAHSERTNEPMVLFPTRFRRTLATRSAREGYGELVIAELLDHSDTQNARIYTENVPENVDAINEAMALQLAPYAQAFAGVLVKSETEAARGDDLSSRIRSSQGTVGNCGQFGFCGALSPIACYTCRHFQPWIDAPHQEMLQGLIDERQKVLAMTKDPTIAGVNDRTIFAVAQVVRLCEGAKAGVNP